MGVSCLIKHVITNLKSCTVTQNFCNSQQLTIGGFPASEVTCEFNAFENGSAITSYAYKNKLMFVEAGVVTNPDRSPSTAANIVYIPIGYFKISECESENDYQTVLVKGYDISADWTDTFGSASATTLAAVIACLAAEKGRIIIRTGNTPSMWNTITPRTSRRSTRALPSA